MLVIIEYETLDSNTHEKIDEKTVLLTETKMNNFPKELNITIEELKKDQDAELSVKKPFGSRNKEMVRVVSEKIFKQNKLKAVPGMIVMLDGRQAIVKSVNGSRIVVDMNHPLADRDITYKIKLLESAEKSDEKVRIFLKFNKIKADVESDENKIIIKANGEEKQKVENILRTINEIVGKETVLG
ncbi:hypothetical protein KO465_04180 [Candidatus Micrarchaeota archaeon]|nr:hypothetical protein [Candidatus Micrarchaeota archaeon]